MSKKILVTGASGFVGPYLVSELESSGYEVYGMDRSPDSSYQADLLDVESLSRIMKDIVPDYVCHLAGYSSVKDSFDNPDICKKINVKGTENLLSSIEEVNRQAKVLIVTSAHVYGEPEYNPIDELHSLNPNSPYAESRVEQEKLAMDSELDIVISRSFNHTGPGQQTGFVCPDFIDEARKVVAGQLNEIRVGNLSAERDISDVRDVVCAYRLMLEKGENKEIYNVCSGYPTSIQYILDQVIKLAGINPSRVVVDKEKFRPVDVPIMYGDNAKIMTLGWVPQYKVETTLRDMWESNSSQFINKS